MQITCNHNKSGENVSTTKQKRVWKNHNAFNWKLQVSQRGQLTFTAQLSPQLSQSDVSARTDSSHVPRGCPSRENSIQVSIDIVREIKYSGQCQKVPPPAPRLIQMPVHPASQYTLCDYVALSLSSNLVCAFFFLKAHKEIILGQYFSLTQ